MAGISKIDYAGETLIDLRSDTVTPETLAKGVTAHAANGDIITGTAEAKDELFWCEYGTTTFAEITAALEAGKMPVMYTSYSSTTQKNIFVYSGFGNDSTYSFSAIMYGATSLRAYVNSSNVWNKSATTLATSAQLTAAVGNIESALAALR